MRFKASSSEPESESSSPEGLRILVVVDIVDCLVQCTLVAKAFLSEIVLAEIHTFVSVLGWGFAVAFEVSKFAAIEACDCKEIHVTELFGHDCIEFIVVRIL